MPLNSKQVFFASSLSVLFITTILTFNIPYIGLIMMFMVYYVSGFKYTMYYFGICQVLSIQTWIQSFSLWLPLYNNIMNPISRASMINNILNYMHTNINSTERAILLNQTMTETPFQNTISLIPLILITVSMPLFVTLIIRHRTRKILKRVPPRYLAHG